ncbi:MAG TPA: mannonate dehydratase [Kiritimatiellia bacterium]|nr:mannonate dehydratase [Kiritimatiellia bacterium]HPS08216.1 mannonate dehydratase [Kiritimatiellia bacterium]
MKLIEFVPPRPHRLWQLCLQMGITDVVVKVAPELTGRPEPWNRDALAGVVDDLAKAGLRVVALEGDPFDMSPIKLGLPGRDATLEHYRLLLGNMAELGIGLLCYNFMVGTGWHRSGERAGRGGAKATYFSLAENRRTMPGPLLSAEQVWENYAYFVRAVMPEAQRLGLRMGLHPDDPPLPSLGGMARVFGSVAAYDRAYALAPCRANGVTFCQANFKLMGADLDAAARHFGDRIAFVHVRDVRGTAEEFVELFHDEGETDQLALFRTYRELGLDVPFRCDHVPAMAGEGDEPGFVPGYGTLGRLFANGYLKALVHAAGR